MGLLPAIDTFSKVLSDLGRQLQEEGPGGGGADGKKVMKQLYVVSDETGYVIVVRRSWIIIILVHLFCYGYCGRSKLIFVVVVVVV